MISDVSGERAVGFATRNGSSLNYTDFLKSRGDIACYRFLGYARDDCLEGVAGISPQGDLSVYSNEPAVSDRLLQEALIFLPRPSAVFGDVFLEESIAKAGSLNVSRYEKIIYLSKPCSHAVAECDVTVSDPPLSLRVAGPLDQSVVEEWYRVYNEREGTRWGVPDLSAPDRPRLFLTFWDGGFACGCANSLQSATRLWIGRLFTLPGFRRRGIASWTMDQIEGTASFENKSVDLLVFQRNQVAIRFYERRGYLFKAARGYWKIG